METQVSGHWSIPPDPLEAREATACQAFAEEFADEASGILVAHLGRAKPDR